MSGVHSATSDTRFHDQPDPAPTSGAAKSFRAAFRQWLWDDSPYIAMLLLAFIGVILRASVGYWLVLTPLFAGICIFAGWRQFDAPAGRLQMVIAQALIWLALIVTIFISYNIGSQGVLSFSATTIQMMTLLALGTFVAGVQARVWRICAVGVVLFLAAPGVGLLEQSVLLLVAAALVIAAMGGVSWWFGQPRGNN